MTAADSPFEAHPFWDFSLDVYGREGVGAACIELQDRLGLDVNLLLFCLWAGAERFAAFNADDLSPVAAVANEWHTSVVEPLRAVRRRLTDGSPHLRDATSVALRRQVLADEIACEHGEQLIIATAAENILASKGTSERAQAVAANLDAYARVAGFRFTGVDGKALETVLATRLDATAVRRVLDAVV